MTDSQGRRGNADTRIATRRTSANTTARRSTRWWTITSCGDGSDVQPTWEAMRRDNPHITFHSNKRGYIACTATPSLMQADFRIVDRVTIANQPAHTAKTMIVEAGRAGSTAS